MIHLKSPEEIEKIRKSGTILKHVRSKLTSMIHPGITTEELDVEADSLIREMRATPGFKKVPKYKWSLCTPINDQVVHTPPSDRVLSDGDILTIDLGVFFEGFHSDSAWTVVVGTNTDPSLSTFLKTGERVLQSAIDQVVQGNRVGHISRAIHKGVEKGGYSIIHELTGHGIGRKLHEDPLVPGFFQGDINRTPILRNGLVLAIEVIYVQGDGQIEYDEDGWSIRTLDGSVSACFEHTVALSRNKAFILT